MPKERYQPTHEEFKAGEKLSDERDSQIRGKPEMVEVTNMLAQRLQAINKEKFNRTPDQKSIKLDMIDAFGLFERVASLDEAEQANHVLNHGPISLLLRDPSARQILEEYYRRKREAEKS